MFLIGVTATEGSFSLCWCPFTVTLKSEKEADPTVDLSHFSTLSPTKDSACCLYGYTSSSAHIIDTTETPGSKATRAEYYQECHDTTWDENRVYKNVSDCCCLKDGKGPVAADFGFLLLEICLNTKSSTAASLQSGHWLTVINSVLISLSYIKTWGYYKLWSSLINSFCFCFFFCSKPSSWPSCGLVHKPLIPANEISYLS